MLTEAVIRRLAPRARDDYVKALVNGGETFEQFGINTPQRMTAFLATAMAETGDLSIVQESLTYTSPQRIAAVWPSRFTTSSAQKYVRNPQGLGEVVYGGRMGNERNGVGDGDGFRYRGRGFIQITGRDGYERFGRMIGVPLGEKPELLDDADISLKAACAECSQWHKYADRGEKGFFAYSNAINRGNPASKKPPIGWDHRLSAYRRVSKLLEADTVDDDTSEIGDRGALIEGYQKRLAELRYPVGAIDGIFGSRMRAAVLAFQAENDLATDGCIGPVTRAALNKPDAKPMPLGERATATAEDLAKAGSTTIIDAKAADAAAKVIVTTSVISGVQQSTDVLGTLQGWVGDVTSIKGVVDPALGLAKWAFSNVWVLAIVAGIVILQKTNAIQRARVMAHKLGQHLGR